MNEQFDLPFTSLMFQILFKGFAIHGGSNSEDAKWTNKRLELVWQACLAAIKQTRSRSSYPEEEAGINIPSMVDVEIEGRSASAENEGQDNTPIRSRPPQSAWDAFIADFTTVPGDRNGAMAQRSTESFASPFFPTSSGDETNPLYESDSDDTYSLPPADSTVTPATSSKSEISEIRPTKWLVIWLIRAYAHCTGSRLRLEEIWGTVRKVWKPTDFKDRDAAVRALRHALQLCDSRGPR